VSGVGVDEGQTELMDLVEKLFEAFVLGDPCADLRNEVFGDVNGACLAVLFAGEVLSGVEGPAALAAAGRLAAAVRVRTKGGGEDGLGGRELLEASLQHALDLSGVLRDPHGASTLLGKRNVARLSRKTRKEKSAKKRSGRHRRTEQTRPVRPCKTPPHRCEKKLIPHGCQHLDDQPALPFSHLLPAARLRPLLEQLGLVFRQRLFDPLVTLWTFLSQVLSADGSCREAVVRLLAWRVSQGLPPCSADTASYCQARQRLPLELVRTLTRQTGQVAPAQAPQSWLWRGRHVKIVDGTTLTMPDTPANQEVYPQRSSQAAGVGFPMARLVAIFSLAYATVRDLALGPAQGKKTGENTLFRTLWEAFTAGDLVLGDRLFDAYRDIAGLWQRQVDVLLRMRGGRRCDFRRGRWLGTRDHVVTWKKPRFDAARFDRVDYDALPDQLAIRELHARVSTPGFRTHAVVLVTTLVDGDLFAKAELVELYRQRWHCELDLNALKTTLRMEHLRCQSPEMVEKEIWVHLLAYNLLRQTMAEAARTHEKQPRELSFKGAQQAVNAFAPHLAWLPEEGERLWRELLGTIASQGVGNRPNRVEPRKLKRRQGRYPYMTRPRKQERQACYT
jgi:hypothetical protein